MTATLIAFPDRFGGTTLQPGTWLYCQLPGNHTDAALVVRVEGSSSQAYDVLGGMRALPRTRVWIKPDGGASPERLVEHLDDASLRAMQRGNYSRYYGFLELVYPDREYRAAFVARRAEEPARREAAARKVEEERERVRREVGPWFADLEEAIGGGRYRVSDTVEAKVLRRCLRELAGVRASVTVRRYSMASGLNLSPAKGLRAFTDAEAERIAAVFPGVAWKTRHYDRETGEWCDTWRVDDSLHPHKREDRSDGMTDYYDPGGFRVANEYLLAVAAILSEEVERGGR